MTESTQESEAQYFRRDIQGLRALAVILVILAHAKVAHFAGGYIGVDVFFVISGFVITGLLLRQSGQNVLQNLGRFYARRIRRIMPAATLVIIGTLIAAFHWIGPFSSQPLLEDVRWASLFSANFHFIAVGSDYFSQGLPPSLILHFWSLAVEEQFYFAFPLVLFVSATLFGLRRHRIILSVFLAVLVAASAIWSAYETTRNPVAAYYHPFTRFWELGFGALLATLPATLKIKNPRVVQVGQWISIIMIIATALQLTDTSHVPGVLTWWAVAPAGFLLWTGGSTSLNLPSGWLSKQPLRYIGDISYSLYLFHFAWLNIPVQYVLLKYGQSTNLSVFSRIEQIIGALICAALSYHFFENPIRRSKVLDRRPWLTGLLGVGLIGLVWLVAWLIQTYWTL
jgi:peptidoglycan/LPS O-acetylase OafA/YrhL